MHTSAHKTAQARAVDVLFSKEKICVRLKDGREISVPLGWFPVLKAASPRKRKNWRLIGRGIGIHWPDLDEDISVGGLLK